MLYKSASSIPEFFCACMIFNTSDNFLMLLYGVSEELSCSKTEAKAMILPIIVVLERLFVLLSLVYFIMFLCVFIISKITE